MIERRLVVQMGLLASRRETRNFQIAGVPEVARASHGYFRIRAEACFACRN